MTERSGSDPEVQGRVCVSVESAFVRMICTGKGDTLEGFGSLRVDVISIRALDPLPSRKCKVQPHAVTQIDQLPHGRTGAGIVVAFSPAITRPPLHPPRDAADGGGATESSASGRSPPLALAPCRYVVKSPVEAAWQAPRWETVTVIVHRTRAMTNTPVRAMRSGNGTMAPRRWRGP